MYPEINEAKLVPAGYAVDAITAFLDNWERRINFHMWRNVCARVEKARTLDCNSIECCWRWQRNVVLTQQPDKMAEDFSITTLATHAESIAPPLIFMAAPPGLTPSQLVTTSH